MTRKDPDIEIGSLENFKILTCYNEAKELSFGGMVIPKFVSVWLCDFCNLKCNGCWWMQKNGQTNNKADTEKYCLMIDELAKIGIRAIEFSGGGESTLHPGFLQIACHAKSRDMSVGILTNGTILNSSYLEKAACGINTFSYIRISLDVALPKTYFAIKGVDRFSEVTANIESLTAQKDRTVKIGVKFLINKMNLTEIKEMVKLAEMLNTDYIQFKAEHSSDNMLDDKQMRYVNVEIRKCRKITDIPIYGNLQREKAKIRCFMSAIHAVIDCTGNVYTCCFLNDNRGFIGNVIEDGFENVWFTEKHKKVLQEITNEICDAVSGPGGCRWYKYNEAMNKVLTSNNGEFNFL